MTTQGTSPSSASLPHEATKTSRFAMRFSERRLILMGLDLVALNGALLLSLGLRPEYRLDWRQVVEHPHWFLLLSLLWLLLAPAFDAYDLRVARRFSLAAPAVIKAGLATSIPYSLIPYLTPPLPSSRSMLFIFPISVVILLLAGRGLYILALSQPLFCRRTLIIGAGWAGRAIAGALAESDNGVYQVVGFVDDDPDKLDTVVTPAVAAASSDLSPGLAETSVASPRVLGDCRSLHELITQRQVRTVVLAITHQASGELLQTLMDCLELGVDVIPMPALYEHLTGRVPIEHVGDSWYVAMPIDHPGTGAIGPLVKRVFDFTSAGLGALCLGLAFPFIALAIYLDSPGPIFYTQQRVGKGGRVFKVYKFRSMIPDAEQGTAIWAVQNDDRVTRVGRLLRKTHLDEFPQFFNILKGEMSAVGPRPERPEFVEELADEIPFYRVRHAVKPGMAGWGLIKQGYGSSKEDAFLKLQYDLYYIKHQSIWLDIVILLKTVVDTLTLRGR